MASWSITLIIAALSCFCTLVTANDTGAYVGGGVGGLVILILDIIAFVDVLRSDRSILSKLLWLLLIVFFPIGGLIIWCLCGRKTTSIA